MLNRGSAYRHACMPLAAALMLGGLAPAARAQEETKTEHEKKVEELEAEAELERARADRDKAAAERIEALGLPSFSGETKLDEGAGAMEATMLATHALQAAAVNISGAPEAQSGSFLVLAGNEVVDFGEVGMIEQELSAIRRQFQMAGVDPAGPGGEGYTKFFESAGGAIAAVSALAGLLRSETQITPVELPAISERALANAVAGRLGGRAILPAAAVGRISKDDPLIKDLDAAFELRQRAETLKKALSKNPKTNAQRIASLTAAIARYDGFFTRVTTANDKGVVPIARAARLQKMLAADPHVLRVFVDKAGGSLINTKNIATTFGIDPLKVSGAVVASYSVTNPDTGNVLGSNLFVCRTTLSRLRPIHDAAWTMKTGSKKQATKAVCTPAGA